MPYKKRKCINDDEDPTNRINDLLTSIADDDGKMEALIRFCEQSMGTTGASPQWAKEANSFFSSLSIQPMEWNTKYDFPREDFEQVRKAFKMEDCDEKINQFKNIIKSKLDIQMTTRNVYELLSAISKIYDSSNKKDLGELIVSGTISNLLDLHCISSNINQNGDKQSEICLSDEIPSINVRNDGFLYTNDITFLLREDKPFDEIKKWHETGTDCYKLIICLKSLLIKNMQLFAFDKSMMEKYSKVMGLSFLKSVAYLFVLEASFEEVQTGSKVLIVPKYSIYFKQYGIQQLYMLNLWLDIAFYIKNYVPLDISEYPHQPYRPTEETPLKNLTQLDSILISQKSDTGKKTVPKRMKKNKKVIRGIKSHDGVYVVQSASVIKTISEQENHIIHKLLDNHQHCLYLPQILNIWKDAVEFEFLQPLTKNSYKDEFLLTLACDISTALNFLHTNNIVHRDVKPSNIMIKKLQDLNGLWFVLIDFGLSFEMVKDEYGNCFEVFKDKQTLVTANDGTGIYKAPEVKNKQPYDEKIDIYSLGATILYLKNVSVFLQLYTQAEEIDEVVDYQKSIQSVVWSIEEFGQMVLKMVDLNPKNRPSAEELERFFSSLVYKYL